MAQRTNILRDLSEPFRNEIKLFIEWYKTKRFIKTINDFVLFDTPSQIGTILQYTSETYNLTACFNSNVFMISYFDADKAKDKIIEVYRSSREVTDIVFIDAIDKNSGYEDMAVKAIFKLFIIIRELNSNGDKNNNTNNITKPTEQSF